VIIIAVVVVLFVSGKACFGGDYRYIVFVPSTTMCLQHFADSLSCIHATEIDERADNWFIYV
jgi:hypothetical protein